MLTWNKAAISALGPALTTILLTFDARLGWNFGPEFWGAVLSVGFGILAFVVPNAEKPAGIQPLKCAAVLALLLTLAMLAGCSMVPYYSQVKAVADTGISTAITDRREFNDKKLAVNLAALCDSSVGAVNRYPDPAVRDFVNRLCGGDPSISMDQLSRTMDLLNVANGKVAKLKPPIAPEVPADVLP